MKIRTSNILLMAGLSIVVFVAVSATTVIVADYLFDAAPQATAHYGEGPPPPPNWVDPETGIVDFNLMPDHLPVVNNQGEFVGYMTVDKDPNDDPNPGDEGFDEWISRPIEVTSDKGGTNVVGHLIDDGAGAKSFVPLLLGDDGQIKEN